MSVQTFNYATAALRQSDSLISRLADRFGPLALVAMGLAMGGITAIVGH